MSALAHTRQHETAVLDARLPGRIDRVRSRPLDKVDAHFWQLVLRNIDAHDLPKFANRNTLASVSTMNISLPDGLKDFVDEQVNRRGFGSSSEYVRELIRRDQDRVQLRGLLIAGASSAPTVPVSGQYFDRMRAQVRKVARSRRKT